MLHKLLHRAKDERGFTLIELLVVVLIIGILAAIAIPSFINQRGKAQDSEAKSGARSAQTAMETFFTDNQNYNATDAQLRDIEQSLATGRGTTLAVVPGANTYSLTVTSNTTNTFTIAKAADGTVTRACTRPNTRGGCPAGLAW